LVIVLGNRRVMSNMHPTAKPNNQVTISIDGILVTVPEGTSVINAAKKIGIQIPVLCYHPDLAVRAACRVCLIEVKGQRKLKTACNTEVWEGAEIITNSKIVRDTRKTVLELILASHPQDCLQCVRSGDCELQQLARTFGIGKSAFEFTINSENKLPIKENISIVRDPNKCIKCERCVAVCQEVQEVGAINTLNRSTRYAIGTPYDKKLEDSSCVLCGQCIAVCPVGAIYEKDNTAEVWSALDDKELHVIVQVAPAVRVALGEEFGRQLGSIDTGKMVTALRRLGFDKVFDTNFAADVTIMEEGNELLERIQQHGVLPLITSCSPGWVNFVENFYPELLPNVSTCKSPQQIFGALTKTYYAEKAGISPEKIVVVSIMPCTAKKYESSRSEMNSSGYRDVDIVLTTRELARMIKEAGIDFTTLDSNSFDEPMGIATGAGAIFGTTGGVMEAALRTVYELVTGQGLERLDFEMVRGPGGIKEAEIDLNGVKVKVAVAHGLKNARILMEKIKKGECDYTFIEIMGCPGGCIGGGGQPITTKNVKGKRMAGLYQIDRDSTVRQSHKNPAVIKLYEEFLGKPLSHKSHELLHTHYRTRKGN
jgi:NADP-reducing hydrogenase subunit HndD